MAGRCAGGASSKSRRAGGLSARTSASTSGSCAPIQAISGNTSCAATKGVCARCGTDCIAEFNRIRRLRWERRERAFAEWGLKPRQSKSLWDADHIVPVIEGGGECDLDNLRTLCLKCHRQATADLRQRLATVVAEADPHARHDLP